MSQPHRFNGSSEDVLTAAKSGIRNNMLQRLGTYQPQWLPSSSPNGIESPKKKDSKNQTKYAMNKANENDKEHSSSFSSLSFIASSFSSTAMADGSENSEFILIKSSPVISPPPKDRKITSRQNQQQFKAKDNNRYAFNDVYY